MSDEKPTTPLNAYTSFRSGDIVRLRPEVLAFYDLVDKDYELIRLTDDKWGYYRIADDWNLSIRNIDISHLVDEMGISEGDMVQVVIKDRGLGDIVSYRRTKTRPLGGRIGKVMEIRDNKINSNLVFPILIKFEDESETVSMFRTNLVQVFTK